MKGLFKKTGRMVYFLAALLLSVGITYGISMASEKSKGPLISMFDQLSDFVYKVEHKIILDRRENQRMYKLKWFAPYRDDKEKLTHPEFILLGASDASNNKSYENIINLEDSLQTTFALIHIYAAWGSKPEHEFPEEAVNAIYDLGSVPVITWEPWVTDFDEKAYKLMPLKERMNRSMLSVANGTYDLYIKEWAIKAKKFGHPIYLRFGHEMNDPYRYPWGPKYSNRPKDYVQAWQHVHDIFTYMKADNIIWTWSPHTAYSHFGEYYPGDKYVDVVSTGVLNYGTVAEWSKWWSFEELFGNKYEELAQFNKPIMIAEFGSLEDGGDRAKWFGDALHDLPKKYPLVTSLLFFHHAEDQTVTNKKINWYIKKDAAVTKAIKKEFEELLIFKRNKEGSK